MRLYYKLNSNNNIIRTYSTHRSIRSYYSLIIQFPSLQFQQQQSAHNMSSSEEESDQEVEDEEFNQAFGRHTGINQYFRNVIKFIKDNNAVLETFVINHYTYNPRQFTGMSWRLLGRYIANNTHLETLDLDECSLTDERMALLFRELVRSTSLRRLYIGNNRFGIDGVRSLVPFLINSIISTINLGRNHNFNNECFEVVVSTVLIVQKLFVNYCNITNISSLETHLPSLQSLSLAGNIIGREGCITLSNLLQRKGTRLEDLNLDATGIDDEGAELLATSLKNNTKLEHLNLRNNKSITEKGCQALLSLLNDISSIETTYNSNHTLTKLSLSYGSAARIEINMIIGHINSAIEINKLHDSRRHETGRAKVIKYQLDSRARKMLCELQGIEYSTNIIFADIDPILLSNILALIGEKHGHSEFFTSLLPVAPDLMSFINREAMLRDKKDQNAIQRAQIVDQMKELTRQLADLAADDDQIDKRLAQVKLGDSKQMAVVDGGGGREGREKRQRII